jgi:4,5-dihydroxyphthalate decarboxylase
VKAKRPLTLALDLSDRTLGLHLGLVEAPEGVRIVYVPQATELRHERMIQNQEWDLCEFSLATYLVARSRALPFQAIPVFPRRMFTPGLIFVADHVDGLAALRGSRIGLSTLQTTVCVWALGDLMTVYGADLDDVSFVTERKEILPHASPLAGRTTQIAQGMSLDRMLEAGEIDALIIPRIPRTADERPPKRLFPDASQENRRYFEMSGVFPIMHTVVAKEGVLDLEPGLATALVDCFERSKLLCYELYSDPNWAHLVDVRQRFEEDRRFLGADPYPYGIGHNRLTIERLSNYEIKLGLIDDALPAEELFVEIDESVLHPR